ncbi:hypothetical protein J6590_003085 [Homalodisca vitripennis]|nr:hypothetical protein J6590_003085 [Homalodisca vitripennis]
MVTTNYSSFKDWRVLSVTLLGLFRLSHLDHGIALRCRPCEQLPKHSTARPVKSTDADEKGIFKGYNTFADSAQQTAARRLRQVLTN